MRSARLVHMLMLSLLIAVCDAGATTFVPIETTALAKYADQVIVGTVVAKEARWVRGRIITRVAVRSEERAATIIWFEHAGGSIDGVTMRVIGMPVFAPGERVLVMVAGRNDTLRLVGLADGKLRVERRDGHDIVLMRTKRDAPPQPVALHDGIRALRAAAARASLSN